MDSKEFKKEIDQYIDSSYKAFQSYQDMIKELFGVFHKVCEENNIRYYTAFGTLLGIIRDGGMIPWDADIDIMLPITEAEKDIKILSEKLPEDYYLVSNYIDPNYYLCETRMCKKGYDPDIFHIDFFYLIGAPDDEKERRKYRKTVRKTFYLRAIRNQPIKKGDNRRDQLVYYSKKFIKFWLHLIPNSVVNSKCEKLMHKYDMDKCSYYTSWDDLAAMYPADAFDPIKRVEVEGQEYCIPSDSERVLEPVYSDFRSYMPVARRFDEFYTSVQRFNRYAPASSEQNEQN